jgi:polyphosphate kinase
VTHQPKPHQPKVHHSRRKEKTHVNAAQAATEADPATIAESDERSFEDPALYMNRELSLLEFQRRVLDEARDPENKLLERVKFLSIVSSNLDEFFMVRMAALKQKLAAKSADVSIDGLTVEQQIDVVRDAMPGLVTAMYECFHEELLPQLEQNGITIADYNSLDTRERAAANAYFEQTIFPVLTPLAFDPGRPFPHISNLSLNLAVLLKDATVKFARLKVPDSLPPLV